MQAQHRAVVDAKLGETALIRVGGTAVGAQHPAVDVGLSDDLEEVGHQLAERQVRGNPERDGAVGMTHGDRDRAGRGEGVHGGDLSGSWRHRGQ